MPCAFILSLWNWMLLRRKFCARIWRLLVLLLRMMRMMRMIVRMVRIRLLLVCIIAEAHWRKSQQNVSRKRALRLRFRSGKKRYMDLMWLCRM